MAKRREEPEKEENLERWLLTYADLITLLLIFFIILYALNQATTHKYDELARALALQFGGGKWIMNTTSIQDTRGLFTKNFNPNKSMPSSRGRSRSEAYYTKAISMFLAEIQTKKLQVTFTERGVTITLGADLYFAPGSAELNREGRLMVERLSGFLKAVSNNIRVEGHADSRQVMEGGPVARRYPSNWELAGARAVNVVKRLEENGVASGQLSAISYGDTRPIDDGDNPSARAANRRIEIVIIREDE